MTRDLVLLFVAACSAAIVLATHSLGLTLQASLPQAALDVVVAFVVFVVWRAPVVWLQTRRWAREKNERNAELAQKWRDAEEARYERQVTRRRKRR